MNSVPKAGYQVFLTGVTGFVGKVVLEELLRQKDQLAIGRIYILVRKGRHGESAKDRFEKAILPSPCFAKLKSGWADFIQVIEGDLSEMQCGISASEASALENTLTHIVNCAASVEFDLPLEQAAKANITSSLNVLELAKKTKNLVSMVNVSTAYVTPFRRDGQGIGEVLVELPRPAKEIYADIGRVPEEKLLKETKHPNTYTFTKCLSEHLLMENKGDVPLSLVRPSIVSTCYKYPFPGWIDSWAAIAAFISFIGSGMMKVLHADRNAFLDVVPCDVVADKIIGAAFDGARPVSDLPDIRHAVAGRHNCLSIAKTSDGIVEFFRQNNISKCPKLKHVSTNSLLIAFHHILKHRIPYGLQRLGATAVGRKKDALKLKKATEQLVRINKIFPYFTTNTFDFRAHKPFDDKEFTPDAYRQIMFKGVYENLFRRDLKAVPLAGKKADRGLADRKWSQVKPHGNRVIRVAAWFMSKIARRSLSLVTFDRESFAKAMAYKSENSLTVVIPTHRSYADFVLISYLFFAHPELGVSIPHIAAAHEFSKIPVLGNLFKKAHAFYLKRGVGRKQTEINEQIHELVSKGATLEFFVEGTRSRSRKMLFPKRGLLNCLKNTGQEITILPVGITYDRLPEETAFIKELKGGNKPRMRLRFFVRWVFDVIRGKVDLGRVHIECGAPVVLNSRSDVPSLALKINSELQKALHVSLYHLEQFVKANPDCGVSVEELSSLLKSRGVLVLEKGTAKYAQLDPVLELNLRHHWNHYLIEDFLNQKGRHAAIEAYARHVDYRQGIPAFSGEKNIPESLFNVLFKGVCSDFSALAKVLSSSESSLKFASPAEFVRANPKSYLPNIEAAWADLEYRDVIWFDQIKKAYVWGNHKNELTDLVHQYAYPETNSAAVRVA